MNRHLAVPLSWALLLAAACAPIPTPSDALTSGAPLPSTNSAPTVVTSPNSAVPGPSATATDAQTAVAVPSATLPAADRAYTPIPPALLALPEVAQAAADLAERLNVRQDDIQVVMVQPSSWTDSSMGCAQPGRDYLQVVVEGLFIQLSHGGQVYNYHSGGGQPPFLCEQSPGGVLPALDLGKTPPSPPVAP